MITSTILRNSVVIFRGLFSLSNIAFHISHNSFCVLYCSAGSLYSLFYFGISQCCQEMMRLFAKNLLICYNHCSRHFCWFFCTSLTDQIQRAFVGFPSSNQSNSRLQMVFQFLIQSNSGLLLVFQVLNRSNSTRTFDGFPSPSLIKQRTFFGFPRPQLIKQQTFDTFLKSSTNHIAENRSSYPLQRLAALISHRLFFCRSTMESPTKSPKKIDTNCFT